MVSRFGNNVVSAGRDAVGVQEGVLDVTAEFNVTLAVPADTGLVKAQLLRSVAVDLAAPNGVLKQATAAGNSLFLQAALTAPAPPEVVQAPPTGVPDTPTPPTGAPTTPAPTNPHTPSPPTPIPPTAVPETSQPPFFPQSASLLCTEFWLLFALMVFAVI